MGYMANNMEDREYEGFLEDIVQGDHLEGAALGITKRVIAEGKDSLSPAQAAVFKRDVEDEFIRDECEDCGTNIPWSEMYEANDNGGYCSWCAHMHAKGER